MNSLINLSRNNSRFVLLVLFLSATFFACKKEVPSSKIKYVGEWKSSYGAVIRIGQDGSGYWEEGGKYIDGRVKFKSAGFEIKALGFKKKFTVDQEPTFVTTFSPYYYIAKFNGENYHKQ
ncbi:MAG: hypothetical protein L6Q66_11210 [Bacteroidia bacterium]|nr:hypothetical protein [Bacteroidia bacterium]